MLEDHNKLTRVPKDPAALSFAIVRSAYHGEMTQSMADAALETLVAAGVPRENIDTYEAPGSWEVPLLVQHALDAKKYDGVAAFGIIVKGETYHFEMMANGIGRALMDLQIAYSTPVAFEVLAVMDIEHARVRSFGEHNKGAEASVAMLAAAAAMQN